LPWHVVQALRELWGGHWAEATPRASSSIDE